MPWQNQGVCVALLAGGRNLTRRTVADITDAIGISLKVAVHGAEISKSAARPGRTDLSAQTAPRRRLSRIT